MSYLGTQAATGAPTARIDKRFSRGTTLPLLGRGKPSTHVLALTKLTDAQIQRALLPGARAPENTRCGGHCMRPRVAAKDWVPQGEITPLSQQRF